MISPDQKTLTRVLLILAVLAAIVALASVLREAVILYILCLPPLLGHCFGWQSGA